MNEQTESQPEIWQAEIDETVHTLSFDELAALISSGMLLPGDKVRRGNLRWLEAGRVPALDAYFAYSEARAEIAGPPVEKPKSIEIPPVFSEAVASKPAVSASSVVKSFAYVLLLSLVFTYLWMYYRDAADRAKRNAISGRVDTQSVRDLEAEYGVEKKFLTDQLAAADREMAQFAAGPPVSKLSPSPDISMCYRYKSIEHPEAYSFEKDGPPGAQKELDTECVKYQRDMAQKRVQSDEQHRKRRSEGAVRKRSEIAGQLEDLESEMESERVRLNEGFYMAAAKGRFYYGFIPIFLILVTLNTTRIVLRKKLAQPSI